MKKRVRIKDIAIKAGVSAGTVDRVLHERGNVSPEVKQRVMEVVNELGYERNLLASALAYNRTFEVFTLLPNPDIDPYWKQTNFGVLQAAKAIKHYGLNVQTIHFDYFDPKSFLKAAQSAVAKKPEGILFPPIFQQEALWLLEECERLNIPNVIINTELSGGNPLCYIGQDSYQSGFLGARLLNFGLNSGQSACLLNLDYSTKAAHHLLEKERGFRDYFSNNDEKKIQILRRDFDGFSDPRQLRKFLTDLLNDHSTLSGIFVTNSRAYKILDCFSDEIIARKIKIVGFDLVEGNIKYLKENKIDFIINQNPMEQGFRGIMNLFKCLILKEDIEKINYLPLDIVVKENAEYYLKKQLMLEVLG